MEAEKVAADRDQYLTFEVCEELYAIGILDLREIISFQSATRVPMAPKAVRGLINVRGSAVPVLDLAMKFGEAPMQVSKRTCVVIFDSVRSEGAGASIGILADSVSEVIEFAQSDIEEAPDFGMSGAAEFMMGLARVGDTFVPILDVNKLLSLDEMAMAQKGWAAESGVAEASVPDPESESKEAQEDGEEHDESESSI